MNWIIIHQTPWKKIICLSLQATRRSHPRAGVERDPRKSLRDGRTLRRAPTDGGTPRRVTNCVDSVLLYCEDSSDINLLGQRDTPARDRWRGRRFLGQVGALGTQEGAKAPVFNAFHIYYSLFFYSFLLLFLLIFCFIFYHIYHIYWWLGFRFNGQFWCDDTKLNQQQSKILDMPSMVARCIRLRWWLASLIMRRTV